MYFNLGSDRAVPHIQQVDFLVCTGTDSFDYFLMCLVTA